MTYHAGLFGADAYITCDGPGCTTRLAVVDRNGRPYAWFLAYRPAKGWSLDRTETEARVIRVDLCPEHRAPKRSR